MSFVEDKQKNRFVHEISNSKEFLMSLLTTVSNTLEEYEDTVSFNIADQESYNVMDDLRMIEVNLQNMNRKMNILVQQIDLNKQNILAKIEENSSWIENPFHYYESRKNSQILRLLLANEINQDIHHLKLMADDL